MIKVLHLVHAFETGGAERVVLDLTRHSSANVKNTVCSLSEPNKLVSQLDLSEVGFHCLHKQSGNDFSLIPALARLIDREQVDVVHSQGWGTFLEGLAAAKCLSKRHPAFIFAFHGKSIEDVVKGVPLRRRIAQRVAHLFTDACVTPAEHMAEDYARMVGLPRSRVNVIYNGIDYNKFGRIHFPEARSIFGLEKDEFVIGFVGRLDPVKDVCGIIEVFARFQKYLNSGRRRPRLLIIGEGKERLEAEYAVAKNELKEYVLFAGLRTDIPQCMAAMDVYFQPSHYEGHSLTILEAMAAELPVVSTLVGGTPEIISHNSTGFLYKPGDYEQMTEALLNLYRQPLLAAAVGSSGRERVVQHFSVTAMVTQYECLYRKVLNIKERPCAA